MNPLVSNTLHQFTFGPTLRYRNITVFPLVGRSDGSGPDYVVLKEALESRLIRVTEVSEGGSVPDLFVINDSECNILLLDGEELVGAKQNRVLNTTILVAASSQIKVPVSCTEQGRWSYNSPDFADSDIIMAKKSRSIKSASVAQSLACCESFSSDQGAVWDAIESLHEKAGSESPTRAMRDVYRSRERDLDACLEAFPLQPRQQGLVVAVNGVVQGCDLVSRPEAYGKLHAKLVRSYAMDAVFESAGEDEPVSPDDVRKVIESATACESDNFKSVGLGEDIRFQNQEIIGSALVAEESTVHVALFSRDDADRDSPREAAARMRRRRRYRENRTD